MEKHRVLFTHGDGVTTRDAYHRIHSRKNIHSHHRKPHNEWIVRTYRKLARGHVKYTTISYVHKGIQKPLVILCFESLHLSQREVFTLVGTKINILIIPSLKSFVINRNDN